MAFDKELTYEKLEKAAYFLHDGLPYIATHPDKVYFTPFHIFGLNYVKKIK